MMITYRYTKIQFINVILQIAHMLQNFHLILLHIKGHTHQKDLMHVMNVHSELILLIL